MEAEQAPPTPQSASQSAPEPLAVLDVLRDWGWMFWEQVSIADQGTIFCYVALTILCYTVWWWWSRSKRQVRRPSSSGVRSRSAHQKLLRAVEARAFENDLLHEKLLHQVYRGKLLRKEMRWLRECIYDMRRRVEELRRQQKEEFQSANGLAGSARSVGDGEEAEAGAGAPDGNGVHVQGWRPASGMSKAPRVTGPAEAVVAESLGPSPSLSSDEWQKEQPESPPPRTTVVKKLKVKRSRPKAGTGTVSAQAREGAGAGKREPSKAAGGRPDAPAAAGREEQRSRIPRAPRRLAAAARRRNGNAHANSACTAYATYARMQLEGSGDEDEAEADAATPPEAAGAGKAAVEMIVPLTQSSGNKDSLDTTTTGSTSSSFTHTSLLNFLSR